MNPRSETSEGTRPHRTGHYIWVNLEGFMEAKLDLVTRFLVLGCAVALLWPADVWVHAIGMAALIVLFVKSFRTSRKADQLARQSST